MTEDERKKAIEEVVREAVSHWAPRLTAALVRTPDERNVLLSRMMELSSEVKRENLAIDLLYSLAPDAANPDVWLDWMEGGKSPMADLRMLQFDDSNRNSGRKIESAHKQVFKAIEDCDDARRRVQIARDELAAAERNLEVATEAEKAALDIARGVTAWAYLYQVASVASTVFAMGPAWSLMRIVSGYLREDEDWQEELNETQRKALSAARETRAARSKEMLGILHNISGDAGAEARIFEQLFMILKKYEEQAQLGPAASKRTMKTGLGRRAVTEDREQVVKGVKLGQHGSYEG